MKTWNCTVFQLVWNLWHGIFSENWEKSRSINNPRGFFKQMDVLCLWNHLVKNKCLFNFVFWKVCKTAILRSCSIISKRNSTKNHFEYGFLMIKNINRNIDPLLKLKTINWNSFIIANFKSTFVMDFYFQKFWEIYIKLR